MIANIFSAALKGIDTYVVEIEASMHSGIPQINVVGLADQTVREAKDRIIAAFQNNGIKLPNKKFVVCLNPTDLRKQGSHLDLPLSLALLSASGLINHNSKKIGALGAINLAGEILETDQTFSLIECLVSHGCDLVLVPKTSMSAKRFFPNARLVPVGDLNEVLAILSDLGGSSALLTHEGLNDQGSAVANPLSQLTPELLLKPYTHFTHLNYSQVQGQERAKRAIMIAITGHHHLLLYGPPGTGKTMLANRIPTIQPPLMNMYVYERLKLLSCAGHRIDGDAKALPAPFRAPHSGVSLSSMLGGMQAHMLGEATLAHRGVLFLDEMPEFKRDVLEGMRGPLESGTVQLSKTSYKAEVPSNFILVATANPCPCGYNGFSDRCNCNERDIQRYFSKLSGPMLDRFDLKVEVAFKEEKSVLDDSVKLLTPHRQKNTGLDSKAMFDGIMAARAIQKARFSSEYMLNGMMGPDELAKWCQFSEEAEKWANQHLKISSGDDSLRNQFKIVKLARTIADLEASEAIDKCHLIEAFYYNRRKLT